MNFFLLYVSLPALLFRIMSETPFAELNNPPFLIATTIGTVMTNVAARGPIHVARPPSIVKWRNAVPCGSGDESANA